MHPDGQYPYVHYIYLRITRVLVICDLLFNSPGSLARFYIHTYIYDIYTVSLMSVGNVTSYNCLCTYIRSKTASFVSSHNGLGPAAGDLSRK